MFYSGGDVFGVFYGGSDGVFGVFYSGGDGVFGVFYSGGDGVRLPPCGGDDDGAPLQPAAAAERVRRPLPGPEHTAALQRPEERRHETTELYVDDVLSSLSQLAEVSDGSQSCFHSFQSLPGTPDYYPSLPVNMVSNNVQNQYLYTILVSPFCAVSCIYRCLWRTPPPPPRFLPPLMTAPSPAISADPGVSDLELLPR